MIQNLFLRNSANLGYVKIDGHHFSAIDFPILTIVHGSWIMDQDGCMGYGGMTDQGGIIASDLVAGCSIILFVQPFPQHLIKVG